MPGYKIQFKRGRHFMVSKRHPYGEQVYQALERGLKVLRERGILRKALLQSGVINPLVQDWQVVNDE